MLCKARLIQAKSFVRSSIPGLRSIRRFSQSNRQNVASQTSPPTSCNTWKDTPRALFSASLESRANPPKFANRHILLIGQPGSGKSCVGQHLAKLMQLPLIDVDDHWLERQWNCSVASKLAELGDDAFLQAEAEQLKKLVSSLDGSRPHVISLTGSNPLNSEAMHSIAMKGLVVYLDCRKDIILNRLNIMKVDRIVGQRGGKSLPQILQYRDQIYEQSYDVRVTISEGETPEVIARRVQSAVSSSNEFVSTRGYQANQELVDVVKRGLAPDRGLFVPHYNEMRRMSLNDIRRLVGMSYVEIALRVMESLPLGSFHPQSLRDLMTIGYQSFDTPEVLPVTPLIKQISLMEMWHGPTSSFKDLSLQLLPRLLTHAAHMSNDQSKVGLLVATSGDTGTAALDGFSRSTTNPVVVLYPRNGVSAVQRAQMITAEGAVRVLGVDKDFDFCQSTVKDMFNDQSLIDRWTSILPNLSLSSANSMNFGRFLPQIVFAFAGYTRLVAQGVIRVGDEIDICVPTGNFGNLLGAIYARKLGLPLRRLIAASNENNIIHDFVRTGRYDLRERAFHVTHSPSIDILISSNLERFLHLCSNGDVDKVNSLFSSLQKDGWFEIDAALHAEVKQQVSSGWCSGQQCLETIRRVHHETGEIIDPHTAVGVHVARAELGDVPMLVASTAHYGKFPTAVLSAINGPQAVPSSDQSLGDWFNALNSIKRSPNSYIPQALSRLTSAPVTNDGVCGGNRKEIEDEITKFFKSLKQ